MEVLVYITKIKYNMTQEEIKKKMQEGVRRVAPIAVEMTSLDIAIPVLPYFHTPLSSQVRT